MEYGLLHDEKSPELPGKESPEKAVSHLRRLLSALDLTPEQRPATPASNRLTRSLHRLGLFRPDSGVTTSPESASTQLKRQSFEARAEQAFDMQHSVAPIPEHAPQAIEIAPLDQDIKELDRELSHEHKDASGQLSLDESTRQLYTEFNDQEVPALPTIDDTASYQPPAPTQVPDDLFKVPGQSTPHYALLIGFGGAMGIIAGIIIYLMIK